jgi:hypothetical protein
MTATFICPYPLVHFDSFPAHTETFEVYPGSQCAVPCPTLDFSDNHWRKMKSNLSVLILVAFLSSGGVLLAHVVDYNKLERNYYRIMFSAGFFSYSAIIGMFMILNRNDELICDSSAHYIPRNGFCLFQAASTIWFMTWTEIWLLNLVYDLYCKVCDSCEELYLQRARLKRCTVAGLIVPTIVTAIPCFAHNIGFDYEANVPICLYLVSDTNSYFWYSFMIPCYTLLLLSIGFMIACAWRIHNIFIGSKHYETALSGEREITPSPPKFQSSLVNSKTNSDQTEPLHSHVDPLQRIRSGSNQSSNNSGGSGNNYNTSKGMIADDASCEEEDDEANYFGSVSATDINRNSFDINISYTVRESEVSYTGKGSNVSGSVNGAQPQQNSGAKVGTAGNDPLAALQAISNSELWNNRPSYSSPETVTNGQPNNRLDNADEEDDTLFSVDFDEATQAEILESMNSTTSMKSQHSRSYNVSQRIRKNLMLTKNRRFYIRALWVYHRRSIFFVLIFSVMSISLLYYIYQLFYIQFDEYVDAGNSFAACLVTASLNCAVQTEEGVASCAQESCPSYPFPDKVPNIVEVCVFMNVVAPKGYNWHISLG